jgi:hypothetical protein
MLASCLALLAGTAATLAAIQTASGAAFLAGAAVAGAGFGAAMLGDLRHHQRPGRSRPASQLIAAHFIASYVAFSIPVVAAGVAATHVGLHRAALAYCATIAMLAAVAARVGADQAVGTDDGKLTVGAGRYSGAACLCDQRRTKPWRWSACSARRPCPA